MQDMHAVGAGGGRFIGVGDRRLRPHNHLNHQALKCPRCDSPNTKFCYYNNYNLSQPRHFCKSCRRYWTKGGVLRSVPVGGGCRKNKRSKAKNSTSDAVRESKSKPQSSSSDNSSLTAAVATATATTPTSAGTALAEESPASASAPSYTTSDSPIFYNFPDARFPNVNNRVNSNFDHQPLVNHPSTDGQIFSTEMGSFTSLMTSSEEMMGFGMADISYGRDQPVNHVLEAEDPSSATASEYKIEDISAEALDWGSGCGGGRGGGDQDLFDLTGEVDPSYWNQSEWNGDDLSP